MKPNQVAPWEGRLHWVGTPRSGKTKAGTEWKFVDFALRYEDRQGNGKIIVFGLFGTDKVDRVLNAPIGTPLRVEWEPDARQYNGKWFPEFKAWKVDVADVDAGEREPVRKQDQPVSEEDPGDLPF